MELAETKLISNMEKRAGFQGSLDRHFVLSLQVPNINVML
jgi:hypothetical protein